MGIEFAYAAETAFVSPTLLEIGIDHKAMTMVWSLSPMFGFFLAPLMGSLSDRCTLSWGRRRPLILLLSALIFAGLILVPWGKDIGSLFGSADPVANVTLIATGIDGADAEQHHVVPLHRWAIFITIVGTIFLDFSADTCQTPARTYMLDTCISEDHARGLSIFTVLAGLGGCMGYSLGGVDWQTLAIGQMIGNNVKTVFTIVTVLFLISSIITLLSFREIPLPLMEHDELLRPLSRTVVKREVERIKGGGGHNGTQVFVIRADGDDADANDDEGVLKSNGHGKPMNNNRAVDAMADGKHSAEEVVAMRTVMSNGGGVDSVAVTAEVDSDDDDDDDDEDEKITLRQYLMSIVFMPRSMQILCLTNLLSWMAHLSYSLYFTDFVGEAVFGGDPTVSVRLNTPASMHGYLFRCIFGNSGHAGLRETGTVSVWIAFWLLGHGDLCAVLFAVFDGHRETYPLVRVCIYTVFPICIEEF